MRSRPFHALTFSILLLSTAAACSGDPDTKSDRSSARADDDDGDDNGDDGSDDDSNATPSGSSGKDASTRSRDASSQSTRNDAGVRGGSDASTTDPDPDTSDPGDDPQTTDPGDDGNSGPTSAGTPVPDDRLPAAKGTCPALKTGMATINGSAVQLWVGSKPGPLYLYWHGTGQHSNEVDSGLPGVTAGVAKNGGIVASFETTNKMGTNTGNAVWYTGDFDSVDQILACGVQANLIDTSRIYTAGYSAGGLQACAMAASHAKYLAAAICYSGGAATIGGKPADTKYLPSVLLAHGGQGKDTFILDFYDASHRWEDAYKAAGGFAIDCDDGSDHIGGFATRAGLMGHGTEFLNAHTYGQKPDAYAGGLPTGWPSYCSLVK